MRNVLENYKDTRCYNFEDIYHDFAKFKAHEFVII